MTDTHLRDSFMDNTTTYTTNYNHQIEPIPSSVSEFTQEEEGLVTRMEEIIQFFFDLLQVTGGKKMGIVLFRSLLEKGSSKTDTNITTPLINFHYIDDIDDIRTNIGH
jgi:hypothetical protein